MALVLNNHEDWYAIKQRKRTKPTSMLCPYTWKITRLPTKSDLTQGQFNLGVPKHLQSCVAITKDAWSPLYSPLEAPRVLSDKLNLPKMVLHGNARCALEVPWKYDVHDGFQSLRKEGYSNRNLWI